MAFTTHKNGYWITNDRNFFQHDQNIFQSISDFLSRKQYFTVFDFGCGDGQLCDFLNKRGFETFGVDGNPHLKEFEKKMIIADLSKPIKFSETKDCIISLNVGQYIPKEFESNFINNLCNHCVGSIVIRWSAHRDNPLEVNCVSKEYLIEQMSLRNFKLQSSDTYEIKQRTYVSNIFVFEKKKPTDKSLRSVEK